jgi:hypothetical protein
LPQHMMTLIEQMAWTDCVSRTYFAPKVKP